MARAMNHSWQWQEQRKTPSKKTEGLLYAGFVQLFSTGKKEKGGNF